MDKNIGGSHVTGLAGSYILQWKYFDSTKASFDFPLAVHKSKLMYYTELLQSEAFRGSVTSLQSCHSGFSSLSISTNQSSQSGTSSLISRKYHGIQTFQHWSNVSDVPSDVDGDTKNRETFKQLTAALEEISTEAVVSQV